MSRTMNILVAVVILVWASLTTYTEIIDADPDQYSIKSPEVRQQLENCAGTFAQRQACAERITDEREQLGFLVWCEKVVIILGPPIVLWVLMNMATRRRGGRAPAAEVAAPRRVAAGAVRPRPRQAATSEESVPETPSRAAGAAPGPGRPAPSVPGSGDGAPIMSGGRREPVRRRDR